VKRSRNIIQRMLNKVQYVNQRLQSAMFNLQLNLPTKQRFHFVSQLPHFLLQRLHFVSQWHRFPLQRPRLALQWHHLASQLIDWVVKLIDQASQWLDWGSQSIDQASQSIDRASQSEVLYSSKGNHAQVLASHIVINTYSITINVNLKLIRL